MLLPNYELYSLPIPERSERGPTRYRDIQAGPHALGTLVRDLTRGQIAPHGLAHLDPDLNAGSIPRAANWRPLFGQAGAAEKHLQTQQVQPGDLFLFYGWFRAAEYARGTYRYCPRAPDLHVLFGWLQIERRLAVDEPAHLPAWASQHPHCKPEKYATLDSLYIATDQLAIPGFTLDQPGAGVFSQLRPQLQLTAAGRSRSIWQLPAWLYPQPTQPSLTYHYNPARWERSATQVLLHTVGRGQEFVFDSQIYPEALGWVADLFT